MIVGKSASGRPLGVEVVEGVAELTLYGFEESEDFSVRTNAKALWRAVAEGAHFNDHDAVLVRAKADVRDGVRLAIGPRGVSKIGVDLSAEEVKQMLIALRLSGWGPEEP